MKYTELDEQREFRKAAEDVIAKVRDAFSQDCKFTSHNGSVCVRRYDPGNDTIYYDSVPGKRLTIQTGVFWLPNFTNLDWISKRTKTVKPKPKCICLFCGNRHTQKHVKHRTTRNMKLQQSALQQNLAIKWRPNT